jgi:hypothetical protein
MVYVPKNKISDFPASATPTFEHIEGESLKDAWYRIKILHTAESNPCSEAILLMNFYFGCKGWGKHSLDLAAMDSFTS